MSYELITEFSQDDWDAYHRIRREVLWEARGLGNYNAEHTDEHVRGNHPLLLRLNDRAIATTRLDEIGNGAGVVRLVAVAQSEQRQGHGRTMATFVENYARDLGLHTLYVNAFGEAIGFYEKTGWHEYDWDEAERRMLGGAGRQMKKPLASGSS